MLEAQRSCGCPLDFAALLEEFNSQRFWCKSLPGQGTGKQGLGWRGVWIAGRERGRGL